MLELLFLFLGIRQSNESIKMLFVGGRSAATGRRVSQNVVQAANTPIKRNVSSSFRNQCDVSTGGRRRALDLYGTKDVVFTHEQVKRAQKCQQNSGTACTFS